MTAELDTRDRPSAAARIRHRLLAIAVAVAAPIVVWIVASVAGVGFEVTSPAIGTLTIDVPLVIVSTIPLALAAWGVLALLERRTPRARTIWTVIAIAVLVLSLPPLALLDATIATKVALGIMHLAAGVPLILMLRHGARDA
ncbi:DUF6069 family protein [Agromyces sp. SYSU K20354]|uniref:DUF6069 family protein n=1 Tax=Agromyces cavernae TaxID=2898659 RepID=UPI001E36D2B0|nr:DUF6069 family protein [Agromyces cavernae]MCD2443111.1 DUF6069 family protein [Agromyces cavernae]